MIVQEHLIIDGRNFIKTYSNENRYIIRENVEYTEAFDPEEFGRIYTEGDLIPEIESEVDDQEDLAAAARILLGVDEE